MIAVPPFEIGDIVTCGQILGKVGQSGYNIPVAHLHIETRLGPQGAKFKPMAYYDTQAVTAENESYLRWRISGEFEHFDPMLIFEVD